MFAFLCFFFFALLKLAFTYIISDNYEFYFLLA